MKYLKKLSLVVFSLLLVGTSVFILQTTEQQAEEIVSASEELDRDTKTARDVHLSSLAFLSYYIPIKGDGIIKEEYIALREDISPYISEELLGKIYEDPDALEAFYGEEVFVADESEVNTDYTRKFDSAQVFIDYETLTDRTIYAIAYVEATAHIMGEETKIEERVNLRLIEENDRWVVDEILSTQFDYYY